MCWKLSFKKAICQLSSHVNTESGFNISLGLRRNPAASHVLTYSWHAWPATCAFPFVVK